MLFTKSETLRRGGFYEETDKNIHRLINIMYCIYNLGGLFPNLLLEKGSLRKCDNRNSNCIS